MAAPLRKPKHNWTNKTLKKSRQRSQLLSKRRENYFKYDMEDLLRGTQVPSEQALSFAATIFAKGSRQGIDDAKDFVEEKAKEGFIDDDTGRKIFSLIDRYATWR